MSTTSTPRVGELLRQQDAPQRNKISWLNLLVGAGMNIFQVSTLGQPLENIKTYAWLEASTKGAILILSSGEVKYRLQRDFGASPVVASTMGGVMGGAAQAYLTMGVTTCMKTVEVTRNKSAAAGVRVPGTIETFSNILRTQGLRGVNKGVNAVALRQITGWSSRMGISKLAEGPIRKLKGKSAQDRLSFGERISASTIGGALSCWNQPFEVIRVDMQAVKKFNPTVRPTMLSTARAIWCENGMQGFFRGVVPRIGVATWATICMVGLGDTVRELAGLK